MQHPDLTIVATGLRFPEGPVYRPDGSLLFVEIERGRITRLGRDGTLSTFSEPGGGPNGLAVGPDGALYLCNNGGFVFHEAEGVNRTLPLTPPDYAGGRIERIDAETGAVTLLYDSCNGRRLSGPNDIVFDDQGGFYFSDLGKQRERDRDHGAVYYAKADGSLIREIIFPILSPNGIGLSPDNRVLYVAETDPGRLWAFDIAAPGDLKRAPYPSPHGGRLICAPGGYQRFDSLAVDAKGRICVATLASGCITVAEPDGSSYYQVATKDLMTTNICFGGPDMRTAYITLSGSGEIATLQWPDPGLPLNY